MICYKNFELFSKRWLQKQRECIIVEMIRNLLVQLKTLISLKNTELFLKFNPTFPRGVAN